MIGGLEMLFEKLAEKGSKFLGVKYPIISGGMTWVSTFELVKSVSQNGAFPVLAGGNMLPDLFGKEVDRCIQGLDKPFAVNLITIAPNYKAQFEVLRTKNVPFVVFAGSFPRKADIQEMKKTGKKTMSFASEESIAAQQIRFGIDSLILEGSEAGGHIGFVSLMILLQQVLFNFVQVPIFVGGGIATGRMIAHLLLMGAAGCQLGTRFVMTMKKSLIPISPLTWSP
jgi:enoyl-[acyl-carrier protein] reductase II